MHGPPWGDQEELAASTVDRLGEVLYLLQVLASAKQPERFPPVSRPGDGARPDEPEEPVRMSTREEIRAFFRGPDTSVAVTES